MISGCSNSSEEKKEKQSSALSYLALGDSYTIGEGVATSLRWPVQLANQLRERGLEIKDPKIIAKTGWTTDYLLQAMKSQLDGGMYDLVSVLIGVNNQYQEKSIADFEADLRKIFTKAIEHSKAGKEGIFVVSIPDYGVTPFGEANADEIAKEIAAFNAVLKKVAADFELDFYDITPISKTAAENPALVADDRLHPSGEMYSLWVDEILDEILLKLALD